MAIIQCIVFHVTNVSIKQRHFLRAKENSTDHAYFIKLLVNLNTRFFLQFGATLISVDKSLVPYASNPRSNPFWDFSKLESDCPGISHRSIQQIKLSFFHFSLSHTYILINPYCIKLSIDNTILFYPSDLI